MLATSTISQGSQVLKTIKNNKLMTGVAKFSFPSSAAGIAV
jgi:hypothetical protein